MTLPRLRPTLDRLRSELLAKRNDAGHWRGRLSDSALATATACSALGRSVAELSGPDRDRTQTCVAAALQSLAGCQNPDGGYGDTDRSHSNVATSYLVLAADAIGRQAIGTGIGDDRVRRLRAAIETLGGRDGLRRRYGNDKTFVVPILTNLAIAGLASWREVPALPFEAAWLPQKHYRRIGLPVVSYAVPALVAIGQAKHLLDRSRWPIARLRDAALHPTLKVLRSMQPASGGFLEATPLTAFVCMSLAATDRSDHPVAIAGRQFLIDSMRDNGQWPIDTDLATWVTSLATVALASDPADDGGWSTPELTRWQFSCQHTRPHPLSGAEPGGWGWTDLSGAVPDADDTPAAILSLSRLDVPGEPQEELTEAVEWLMGLQNRDGGFPTFCRGWGKLPFDRSSTDLTAHSLRALQTQRAFGIKASWGNAGPARNRGLAFLRKQQQTDGSWLPLWFGNQDRSEEDNPVYGTARVLVGIDPGLGADAIGRAASYLVQHQNADGGWGGGPSVARHFELPADQISTVEETAVAVEALSSLLAPIAGGGRRRDVRPARLESESLGDFRDVDTPRLRDAIISGTDWLIRAVDADRHLTAWPIGFYFAKLWYYEELYPLIFATAALGRVAAIAPRLTEHPFDRTPV